MRKLLSLISIILLLGSCTPRLYQVSHHVTDLSFHTEKGFFITTGDYVREYEPIGILASSCQNGVDKNYTAPKQVSKQTEGDDIYYNSENGGNWRKCTIQDLIDEMAYKASDLGADALIRVRITPIYLMVKGQASIISGYSATGTAIKRIK